METKPDYFPDVWNDDTRMSVLFAPFREKSLNPSSWNQKMTFWKQLIFEDCRKNQISIISTSCLRTKFTRKGRAPLCLDDVLEEMLRCKMIKKLSGHTNSPVKPKSSWLSWGYDTFLKTPVTWGFNYLSASQTEKDLKYVMVDVLQTKCADMVDQHYCGLYCDSVINYNQLWKKSQCDSEEEFNLILEELVKQKKISIYHDNSLTLIKFASKEDKSVKPVSEQDIEIFRIRMTRDMLIDRVDLLSSDIDRLKKEALRLKKSSRTQALRCLRQKKLLEMRIEKLTGSLDMLDNILYQIGHSASDEMVVKAVESGNSVLKSLLGKMSEEHVTDVMDELAEVLEQQADIQEQISSGPSGLDVSRDELESELEEIMKSDADKEQSELLIDDIINGLSGLNLPSVPSDSIVEVDKSVANNQIPPNAISQGVYMTPDSISIQSGTSSSARSHSMNLPYPSIDYSPLSKNARNSSTGEFDLSMELPDVPSFVPTLDKSASQACTNS